MFRRTGLVCSLAMTLAATAIAAVPWPDGLVLSTGSVGGQFGTGRIDFFPDGTGSMFVVGYTGASFSEYASARRFSTAGSPLTPLLDLWAGGSPVTRGFSPDGLGGFADLELGSTGQWLALGGYSPVGAVLPSTTILSRQTPMVSGGISAAPADGGGAWFVWPEYKANYSLAGVRLLRSSAAGGVATGWPVTGWFAAPAGVNPYATKRGLAADGHGGALLMLSRDVMKVVRVAGDTTFTPGWPAGGLALETTPTSQPGIAQSVLMPSGVDHFLAAWLNVESIQWKCQRFSLDGTLDPAWPEDGLVVDSGEDARVVPDGTGGVYVLWWAGEGLLMRHVLASGQFAVGSIETPPQVLYSGPYPTNAWTFFAVTTGRAGGCCLVDFVPAGIRARWFDAAGNPDPSPAAYEKIVTTGAELLAANMGLFSAPVGHGSVGCGPDGEGGVYIGWGGNGPTLYVCQLYVTHASHPLDALLDAPTPGRPFAALAVRLAGANPASSRARIQVSAPAPGPVSLALIDAQGRCLERLDARFEGPGEQTLVMDGLGKLRAGIYWLRVAQAGRSATTRLAIVH